MTSSQEQSAVTAGAVHKGSRGAAGGTGNAVFGVIVVLRRLGLDKGQAVAGELISPLVLHHGGQLWNVRLLDQE